jgi:hypothetical protein
MIATGQPAAVGAASWDPSILWTGAYLAGALLVGAVLMELFRRYLRAERNDRLSDSEQLTQYRTLYEQGAISEEEFNRLRAVLGGELRKAARKPAPAAAPDQPPTPGADPPTDVQPRNGEPSPPDTGIKPA